MKKLLLWVLAFLITIGAAIYQRQTGPTYPKKVDLTLNNKLHTLKLVRSIGHDERSEVKLKITDPEIQAKLYYKRFKSDEDYRETDFVPKVYKVDSYLMNKVFDISEEKGLFAEIPQQPAAGKLQYYFEITDSAGTHTFFKEDPIVIRYKGAVPGFVLLPHVLFMFLAMLFSTLAGLMSLIRFPLYRKYAIWTLILLTIGGMIMGPLVQNYAFGEYWTGIPFGWDLTDNKTLIAYIFWIVAVVVNWKKERPLFVALAALVLLLIFSIPHSLFGSELDYSTGQVTQGISMIFF